MSDIEYEIKGWPGDLACLTEQLAQTGLPEATLKVLYETARPALMLATQTGDDANIPVGTSKIGGRPDLPPGMSWPMRAPYPDGQEQADEALEQAAATLAGAGVAPPWLSPAQAKRLITKTQKGNEKTNRDLARMQKESEKELRDLLADDSYTDEEKEMYRGSFSADPFEPIPILSAEEAQHAARYNIAKSKAMRGEFPLAFIAQLDLATLAGQTGFDDCLPRSGRLYLFYDLLSLPPSFDPASRAGFHIAFDENTPADQLVRTELPPQLTEAAAAVPEAALKPASLLSRPALTTATLEALPYLGLRLRQRQHSDYDEWLLGEVAWPGEPEHDRHQVGGWPRAVQMSMQAHAQLASQGVDAAALNNWKSKKAQALLAGLQDWRLIFQLGPDDAVGNLLPGSLNFLLREEDLAAKRFDRAWVVYEQT